MEKLFGRTYETLGETNGDLLLKTRGNIKVQIGSSFIDLVKGGKINANVDVIKEASTTEDISDNGLYLVDQILYARYNDTTLQLTSSDQINVVSYLEQNNITLEQQIQAQKNMGIYYDTEDAISQKNISNGFTYIKGKGLCNIISQKVDQLVSLDYLLSNVIQLQALSVNDYLRVNTTQLKVNSLSFSQDFQIIGDDNILLVFNKDKTVINNTLWVNEVRSQSGSLKIRIGEEGTSYLYVDNIICPNVMTEATEEEDEGDGDTSSSGTTEGSTDTEASSIFITSDDEITVLKSQVANLQKAVQDLQNKLETVTE